MLVFRGVPSVRITFASEVLPNFQFKTNVAKMDIVGDKLEGPKMPKAVQLVDANLRSKQYICGDCCMKPSPVATTPLKFNMEPEKKSLEKEIPFGNHHFQVPC